MQMDSGALFAEGDGIWSSGQPPIPAYKPSHPSPRLVVTPTGEMALAYEPAPAKRTPTWLDRVNAFGDDIDPRNVLRGVIGREAFDRLPTVPRNLGELFGVAATGLEWGTAAGDMVDLYNGGQMFARGVRELDPWQMIGGASTEVAATLGMLVPGRPGQVRHAYFAPSEERGVAALVTPGLPAARAREAFADEYGHRVDDLDPATPAVSFRERKLGHMISPRVHRIGRFWDDLHLLQHRRRQGDLENPHDYQDAARQSIAEIKYQLKQPDSGVDWYKVDVGKGLDIAGYRNRMYNEGLWRDGLWVPPEDIRILTTSIAASLSAGQRPARNFRLALEIMDEWARSGQIPVLQPSGKNWTQWSSATRHLRFMDYLLKTLGTDGAVKFLTRPQRVADVREMRRRSGQWADNPRMGLAGMSDELIPGALILGPKQGPFFLSANGYPHTVLDLWEIRDVNRKLGRMTYPGTPGHAGVFDKTRNTRERYLMERLKEDVARQVHMSRNDAQAVSWFFQQHLHHDMGQTSARPGRFSEGAEDYVEYGGRRFIGP